jgi:hypothetical protein
MLSRLCISELIQIYNEFQASIETVLPVLEDLTNALPKNTFLQVQKAILYHNSRGKAIICQFCKRTS